MACLFTAATGAALFAQVPEMPPLVPTTFALNVAKAGQLAVSPTGDRVAVADRFANRVYVVDSYGKLLWLAGEGGSLAQPTAVMWSSGKELVISEWDSRLLLRAREDDPRTIDTAADLSAALGDKGRVLRLYPQRDRAFLALTEHPDVLSRLDSNGRTLGVLIEGGSGRGRLGRAVSCAFTASGRLAIAGNGTLPLQIFDVDGKLLVVADWNRPAAQSAWTASALAVDGRDMIWVADVTNAQFRRYDQTGTLLDTRPFAVKTSRPVDMAVTSDNHLIVVDASGRLDSYDLSRER